MSEKTLDELVSEATAECVRDYEAAHRAVALTAEQEIADRDAQTVFEMKDGALVARNDARDPGDALSPLTVARWLQQLAKTDSYLFLSTESGKAH